MTALSGSETVEQAYGLAKLLRAGARRARAPCCPRRCPTGSTRFRAPLSAIRDAKVVVVLCDEPVVERAPIVDLWLKAARRNGRDASPDRARPTETVEGAVLITDDAEHAAWFARDLDAAAAFYLPLHAERPRRRRRLERGRATASPADARAARC